MPETVQAEITGRVQSVLVAPGDAVEEHDPMVVLVSMKLPIPVRSEGDGVVISVRVAVGDVVGPGQPLVDLATE